MSYFNKISLTDSYKFDAENTPMGETRTIEPERLVGSTFEGNTIDPNFRTSAATGIGASISQSGGQLILTSGTGASTVTSYTQGRARYIGGSSNRYRAVIQNEAGTSNNVRNWGVGQVSNFAFTITSANVVAGNVYTNNGQQFTVLHTSTGATTIHCDGSGTPAASGTLTQIVGTGGNLTFSAFAVEAVPYNGAWFQLDGAGGTVFSVVTMKDGVGTSVASGNFNGDLGASYAIGTNAVTYEIYWTNSKVWFVIGDSLLHIVDATPAVWSSTFSFRSFVSSQNVNTATSKNMYVRTATIYRMGRSETQTKAFHGTTAATTVLKYGPGQLHGITINNAGGTLLTIYDGIAAVGQVLAVINTPNQANPVTLDYNLPYYYGLTVVSTGTWDYSLKYQ